MKDINRAKDLVGDNGTIIAASRGDHGRMDHDVQMVNGTKADFVELNNSCPSRRHGDQDGSRGGRSHGPVHQGL